MADKDKMSKAISFFKQGRVSEKRETPETDATSEAAKILASSETFESLGTFKTFAGPLQSEPEVKDKAIPEPAEKKPVQEVKKVSPLFAKSIAKVSALFATRKASPLNPAPAELKVESKTELKTENEISAHNDQPENGNGNGKGKGNGSANASYKERPGWISPKYCQSRTVHLDPGFIAENRCLAYLDNVPGAEAYKVLRTHILQRTRGTGGNMIMVTSAMPAEGKTLTAINLAFTFAREFQHTVLLVDGDLRKQSVHKYLGSTGEKGLINYLVDGTPVSELITYPGIEKMTFISGGPSFKESAEILGSPRMKELIAEMKGRYPERYIIFDVPPILTGADVLTLAPLIDQVIIVVQTGKTSMDDTRKALKFLPKEKILGFVMNRC